MKALLARIAAAATAFQIGRTVGRHVDLHGLDFSDDVLRSDLQSVWGDKQGKYAFAAGVATLGWALVTKREVFLLFLAGLAVGWGVFDKILDRIRARKALPTFEGEAARAVDTSLAGGG